MAIEKAVEVRTPDGVADGLLYMPSENGQWPGIVAWTHLGGIGGANIEMSKRLADEGFVVFMPNQFYRTKKPPIFDEFPFVPGDPRVMQMYAKLSATLPPDAIGRDTKAYADYLLSLPQVKKGKLGMVGYCMSGAYVMVGAAAHPELIGAIVSFHGGGLYTAAPDSPHTMISKIKAKQYYGHATNDSSIPAAAIAALEVELKKQGADAVSETYSAKHGWTHPGSAIYHEADAEKAHREMVKTFRTAGLG
jgi:carboxymethylenebutenolidase